MPKLDARELETHDGKEGRAAYVSVRGTVYDVSGSSLWESGLHMDLHLAGADLTEAIERAPHGMEVLDGFPKVGVLVEESPPTTAPSKRLPPRWVRLLLEIHSHPILAHFPQAFFVFAPLFLALFYITGLPDFERTAYFILCAGFLMAFPATATGFLHWWYRYGGKRRPVFRLKITLSLLLLPVSGLTVLTHSMLGVLPQHSIHWGVVLLYWSMVPIITLIGRAGGLIVFGGKGR